MLDQKEIECISILDLGPCTVIKADSDNSGTIVLDILFLWYFCFYPSRDIPTSLVAWLTA